MVAPVGCEVVRHYLRANVRVKESALVGADWNRPASSGGKYALGCTCSKGRQGQEAYNEGNECEEEAHEALHLVVQPAIRREYSLVHAVHLPAAAAKPAQRHKNKTTVHRWQRSLRWMRQG